MRTGSDTHSTIAHLLKDVAASQDAQQALRYALQLILTQSGASGVSLTGLGDINVHFMAGDATLWVRDVDVLLQWAKQLPPGLTEDPPTGNLFQPQVASWLTVVQPERFIVCVWFASPTNVDVEAAATLIDLLVLVGDRYVADKRRERAALLADSVLYSIVDPVVVLDENHHVVAMNPAAESVFQTSSGEAVTLPLTDVVNAPQLMALIQNPVDDDERPPEWSTGGEDSLTFLPLLSMVKTPEGLPNGWVLALRDVTRFKQLNRNQYEFMRVVSHDLRSPLTAMQGFADMFRMGMVGDLTEKQIYFIDKILAGIAQMSSIVENIGDAGRFDPETGFYEMQRDPTDLSELAREIVQNHILPAEKQELSLLMEIADDLPIINVDHNMITRAVTNLVDNAIKYTPNGGKVVVAIARDDRSVTINVSDDGYGISEENQRKLFQPHYRIPRKEHKKVKGTGLGLFIVRSVAQRHGGDARVESVLGEGTTFSIVIPLKGANLVAGA
jgi:signal transduction histidine kinase